jgi:hypothetical protein
MFEPSLVICHGNEENNATKSADPMTKNKVGAYSKSYVFKSNAALIDEHN